MPLPLLPLLGMQKHHIHDTFALFSDEREARLGAENVGRGWLSSRSYGSTSLRSCCLGPTIVRADCAPARRSCPKTSWGRRFARSSCSSPGSRSGRESIPARLRRSLSRAEPWRELGFSSRPTDWCGDPPLLLYYLGPVIVMALPGPSPRAARCPKLACGFAAVLLGASLRCRRASGGLQLRAGSSAGWAPRRSTRSWSSPARVPRRGRARGRHDPAGCELLGGRRSCTPARRSASARQCVVLPMVAMLGLVNTGLGCYLYFSAMGRLSVQSVSVLGLPSSLSLRCCSPPSCSRSHWAPVASWVPCWCWEGPWPASWWAGARRPTAPCGGMVPDGAGASGGLGQHRDLESSETRGGGHLRPAARLVSPCLPAMPSRSRRQSSRWMPPATGRWCVQERAHLDHSPAVLLVELHCPLRPRVVLSRRVTVVPCRSRYLGDHLPDVLGALRAVHGAVHVATATGETLTDCTFACPSPPRRGFRRA